MKQVIIHITFFVLQGVLFYSAHAQGTYITRQGVLLVKAFDEDSLATYKFKNINVLLDYEKAEVSIKFKLDDGLDDHIPANRFYSDHDISINSMLSLAQIETQSHPDRSFSISGHLIYNEAAYYIKGEGVLEHLESSEDLSCLLTMRIKLFDESILILPELGRVKDIFLIQTVLNKEIVDNR